MKSTISALLVLALCVFASSTQAAPQSKPILENVFTLELKFGDKDVPDEFLLVRPVVGIGIALNGDIIVSDESKLKVFDTSGKPKKIVGRKGQGPGEFERDPLPIIIENGNICAIDIGRYRYNLFSSNYSLIETKNLQNDPLFNKYAQEKGWGTLFYNFVYPYSREEIYIYTQASDLGRTGEERKNYNVILYQNGEKITTIVESPQEQSILIKNIMPISLPRGVLIQKLMPEKKVVYSETHKDKVFENGKWFYIIYEYNLSTVQRRILIKREYTPVAIPDSIIHPEKKSGYNGDTVVAMARTSEGVVNVTQKEYDQKKTELLKELKVYPGIQFLFYDGNLLFVQTYNYEKNKGWLVDIFNSTTGTYLRSAYFPFIPIIKDGYAYRIVRSADEFPYIEKYKIDPAIYGK